MDIYKLNINAMLDGLSWGTKKCETRFWSTYIHIL